MSCMFCGDEIDDDAVMCSVCEETAETMGVDVSLL